MVKYTGDGKQKWIGGFKTRAEAEAQLLEIALSPAWGSGLGPKGNLRQRLGPIMADWIEHRNCGEQERATRRSRFKRHIEPRLGDVQVAKIAPDTAEAFIRGLRGGHINSTTARKVFDDLSRFMGYCLRMGYTSANPCEAVDDKPKPRRYRSPIAQWSREDVHEFFTVCEGGGDKGLLFLASYFSAARRGEILGLTWPHVDVEEQTVTFVQDLERRAAGAGFDNTKTETSDRTVLLPAWLIAALRTLRKRQREERMKRGPCEAGHACKYQHCKKWHEWNLVFTQANGKPLHGHNITRRTLKEFCETAKVPRIRFHDLRHLHNTILMRKNVNVGIIKSRAGHSTVAVSLDRYAWASLDREEQQVAVAALESVSNPLAGPLGGESGDG